MTQDGDRARGRISFARRLALTLLLPLILLVGERVTAPGVDVNAFGDAAQGSPKTLSLFALGLTPALSAYLTVEFAALLVPRWRPLRHSWPKGRRKLDRAVFLLTVVLAAFQTFGMVTMLRGMPVEKSALVGPHADLVFGLTVLAGASFVLLLAGAISRQGIANGVIVLALVSGVEETAQMVAPWLGALDASSVATTLVPAAGSLVVLTLASFAVFAKQTPETSPAISLPASSIHPVAIAVAALTLPTTLAAFDLPHAQEVGFAFTLPRLRLLALLTVTLGSGGVLVYLFNRPGMVGEFLWRTLDHAKPGADLAWTQKARAALGSALAPTAFFLVCMAFAEAATQAVGFRSVAPLVALLVAVFLDAGAAVRALRVEPELVCIWEERRPYAVPAIRELLEREGIESTVLDSIQTNAFRIFAPFVATRICVPNAEELRARKLVQKHLLPNARATDQSATDANDHVPGAAPRGASVTEPAGWLARVRTPFLAAAALAAVACWTLAPFAPLARIVPPSTPAASLEIVLVDDLSTPFAGIDETTLPRGASLMSEVLMVAGEPTPRSFVRLVPEDGETFAQASHRVADWCRKLGLRPDARVAWERLQPAAEDGSRGEAPLRSYVLRGAPILTGWDVAEARVMEDRRGGYSVGVTLTHAAADRFETATRTNVKSRLAILLDGQVLSAPVIQGPIPGGHIVISLGTVDPARQRTDADRLVHALSTMPRDARSF